MSCKAVATFGTVNYSNYSDRLNDLPWEPVKAMNGQQTRKSCWLTVKPCSCEYRYGRRKWPSVAMPQWVQDIGEIVYNAVNLEPNFNSCNANLYESPEEDLYWHADNESLFRKSDADRSVNIVSVSFGSSRVFGIQANYAHDVKKIILDDGDVMSMEDLFQDKFRHAILPGEIEPNAASGSVMENNFQGRRFNLTFRCIRSHLKTCSCRC